MLWWPDGLETAPRKAIAWPFSWFLPVSRHEAAHLLPRFLHGVVRLLLPFFVIKLVARGCPGAELRPATSQTLKLLAGGQASHESFAAQPREATNRHEAIGWVDWGLIVSHSRF